jgi:galactose-1-phosphate uridylyltransferase
VSNPHPHCQIYATNFVFRTIEVEAEASAAHLADTDNLWRMSFPYRAGASS